MSSDTKMVVYALFDPSCGSMRYIGQTRQDIKTRMRRHKYDALRQKDDGWDDMTHRANWLRKVFSDNRLPEVEVIQVCSNPEEMNDFEKFWIEYFKSIGANLTNSTSGGEGGIVSREPSCSDERIVALYKAGKKSKNISLELKTCKKRVIRVLHEQGMMVPGVKFSKRVVDSLGREYPSITAAASAIGLSVSSVSAAIRKSQRAKRASGLFFEYLDRKTND